MHWLLAKPKESEVSNGAHSDLDKVGPAIEGPVQSVLVKKKVAMLFAVVGSHETSRVEEFPEA